MNNNLIICNIFVLFSALLIPQNNGQRITTIQLEGTQYFISKMNPYARELNYFLAYQYCRSIGLQLVSFDSLEKADAMSTYLKNAGYTDTEFWTSGNVLGSNMLLWMSTGLPFNSTFSYMRKTPGARSQRVFTPKTTGRSATTTPGQYCVALAKETLEWDLFDCMQLKDFICEQTRCYYYNYGAIPVTTSQGIASTRRPLTSNTNDGSDDNFPTTVRPNDIQYPSDTKLTTLADSNINLTLSSNTETVLLVNHDELSHDNHNNNNNNNDNIQDQQQQSQQHPVYIAELITSNEFKTEGPYESDYQGDQPAISTGDDVNSNLYNTGNGAGHREEEHYSTIIPDNYNF